VRSAGLSQASSQPFGSRQRKTGDGTDAQPQAVSLERSVHQQKAPLEAGLAVEAD